MIVIFAGLPSHRWFSACIGLTLAASRPYFAESCLNLYAFECSGALQTDVRDFRSVLVSQTNHV